MLFDSSSKYHKIIKCAKINGIILSDEWCLRCKEYLARGKKGRECEGEEVETVPHSQLVVIISCEGICNYVIRRQPVQK